MTTVKSFNPLQTALDITTSVGKQVATQQASSVINSATEGQVKNVNSVTNPSGILNSALSSQKSKLPSAIANNQALTKALNDITSTTSKPLSNTFNKIGQSINPTSILVNLAGGSTGISESIFKKSSLGVSSFTCGFPGDVGRSIPDSHLIKISSISENGGGTITAKLQKMFQLSVTSEWEPFIEADSKFYEATKLVQGVSSVFGKQISLVNPVTSRRIWKGTSPLKLSVEMKFVAINQGKTFNEVVEPCIRLQRLALPTYGKDKLLGVVPLLNPPGPYATNFSQAGEGFGDIIQISIGNIITLKPVIIKDVSVEYDNKFDENGYPISSTCIIDFESYQIMDKVSFSTAMKLPYEVPSALTSSIKALSEQQTAAEQMSPAESVSK